MIAMAIIAILATAGIQAYTDYVKKWRDTARAGIASDLNTAVVSYAGSNNGVPPADQNAFDEFLESVRGVFVWQSSGSDSWGGIIVQDPVGGLPVCLDANWNADEPCSFNYTAYADGTYAISYGVEHASSTKRNFYKTTSSVPAANATTNNAPAVTKYGVYIWSARYIGQLVTSSNASDGVDEAYIPPGGTTLTSVFRSKRVDRFSGGGGWVTNLPNWSACTAGSQCAGTFCVNSVCSDGSMGSICNTINDCTGINNLSPPWTSYSYRCFNGVCACGIPCITRVDPD
jgi:type II secretory pathway pseudopilin PulG